MPTPSPFSPPTKKPLIGTNTPEMMEASRRAYGGMNPGEGRNPGVEPKVQYGPGGQRVPNPAFYGNVPGAPPAAPPPSNYLPRQGAAPPSPFDGRAFANNPQLGGLAAGVNAIHDQNVANAARPPQPTYVQQQMANAPQAPGASGPAPVDPRLAGAQGNGFSAPPIPMGGYANSQSEIDNRMKAENPFGAFGGTLPVIGHDGRPTFVSEPMKQFDLGQHLGKDSDASRRFTQRASGDINNPAGGQLVGNNTPEQQKARVLFNARRGGTEQRQQDYQQRTANNAADRKAGVQANAIAKKESRRFSQGIMNNDTRFAFQNPQASAVRDVGLANADAVKGNNAARLALDDKRIEANKAVGMGRNAAIVKAGQDKLSADAAANNRPDPFAPAKSPEDAANATALADKTAAMVGPEQVANNAMAQLEQTNPQVAENIRGLGDRERNRVLKQFFPGLAIFGY